MVNRKKRIILIGYNHASKSLKNIQQTLQETKPTYRTLRVRKTSTTYKKRQSDTIIAWGPTKPCPHTNQQQEQAKSLAANKLWFFQLISKWNSDNQNYPNTHINIPEWTTNVEIAQQWIDQNQLVLGRKLLNSHSGKGIILFENETITTNLYCPLYVKYKKKKHEFRVHVFKSQIIDVTQKKKRVGHKNTNHKIRNHQNGWVYCRENIHIPSDLTQQALLACEALNLHSGAVDIIWNEYENKSYVLEINTAPGIENSTCLKYTQAITDLLQ